VDGGGPATGVTTAGAARTVDGARERFACTDTVGSRSDFCSLVAGASDDGCCADGAGVVCCGDGAGACSVVVCSSAAGSASVSTALLR
jgi:hypothetical protein